MYTACLSLNLQVFTADTQCSQRGSANFFRSSRLCNAGMRYQRGLRVRLRRFIILITTTAVAPFSPSNRTELKAAVDAWIANATVANATLGHVLGWDTSRVDDMSGLFEGSNTSCGRSRSSPTPGRTA